MDVQVLDRRIQPDRLLDMGDGSERLTAVDVDDAARIVRLSVVRIEVQRDIRLGSGSVKIFLPQIEDGSDVMHESDLWTLLQGQVEMTLGFVERLAPVVRPMELPVQNLGKRQTGIRFAVARIFADRFLTESGRSLERLAVPGRPP